MLENVIPVFAIVYFVITPMPNETRGALNERAIRSRHFMPQLAIEGLSGVIGHETLQPWVDPT